MQISVKPHLLFLAADSEQPNTSNERNTEQNILPVKRLTYFNCNNLQSAVERFSSSDFLNELQNLNVLLYKIYIDDDFGEISSNELENTNSTCRDKSIVVFIESKCTKNISIFWKSKELESFLTLKHFDGDFNENVAKVYEYVAEFLATSLSKGESGR